MMGQPVSHCGKQGICSLCVLFFSADPFYDRIRKEASLKILNPKKEEVPQGIFSLICAKNTAQIVPMSAAS